MIPVFHFWAVLFEAKLQSGFPAYNPCSIPFGLGGLRETNWLLLKCCRVSSNAPEPNMASEYHLWQSADSLGHMQIKKASAFHMSQIHRLHMFFGCIILIILIGQSKKIGSLKCFQIHNNIKLTSTKQMSHEPHSSCSVQL